MIADSYNNLALAYQYDGQFEKAKECFEVALRIREKVSGKEHLSVGRVLFNFSDLYLRLGEMKKCEDLHDRARQIVEPFRRERWLHHGNFIPIGEPSTRIGHLRDGHYSYSVAVSAVAVSVAVSVSAYHDPLPPDRFPITCTALI